LKEIQTQISFNIKSVKKWCKEISKKGIWINFGGFVVSGLPKDVNKELCEIRPEDIPLFINDLMRIIEEYGEYNYIRAKQLYETNPKLAPMDIEERALRNAFGCMVLGIKP